MVLGFCPVHYNDGRGRGSVVPPAVRFLDVWLRDAEE